MCAAKSRSSRIVCFQYRRCQMSRSPRRVMTDAHGSPMRTDFENPFLMVEQVRGEEERSARNPIATIIRHDRSMPGVGERRKALRFFALRVLPAEGRRAKRGVGENMKPTNRANGEAASANLTK